MLLFVFNHKLTNILQLLNVLVGMAAVCSLNFLSFVLLSLGGVSSANSESGATSAGTCLPLEQKTHEHESLGKEIDSVREVCEKAGWSPLLRLACEAHRRARITARDCCNSGDTSSLCGKPDAQDLAGKQTQEEGEMSPTLNSLNVKSPSVATAEMFERRDTRKKGRSVWRLRHPFLDKSQFLGKRKF